MKNFIEELANYKLGYILSSDLPWIAIKAIEEWYESESLYILAWLKSWDNAFEIEEYLNKSLSELKITLPSIKEAFNTMLTYYLRGIDDKSIEFEEWMKYVYSNLISPFCDEIWESKEYAYSWCGLSVLWWAYVHYTDVYDDIEWWYYYKKWVDAEELRKKYKEQVYDEIKICLDKLEKWTLN